MNGCTLPAQPPWIYTWYPKKKISNVNDWHLFTLTANPFAPGDFAEKRVLKQVVHFAAFWSIRKILAWEVRACKESEISKFSLFLPHFFSVAGHLVGFTLMGEVFRKAVRISGLDERKGRWVVEQDFHGNLQVNVTCFFASFSGVHDWIVLTLVWFERSLHSAQVSGQSYPSQ